MGSKRSNADWDSVERNYRAGILTLREIATAHGVTHGAVTKRAKRDEWERDLSAKIQQKADALIASREVSPEVAKTKLDTDKAIINAVAATVATVRVVHRESIERLRNATIKLLSELECDSEDELFRRIDSNKKLSETMKTLIALEREAYGIVSGEEIRDDQRITKLVREIIRPT